MLDYLIDSDMSKIAAIAKEMEATEFDKLLLLPPLLPGK